MQKKQRTKTFFLTGGGTGGHIYPCVSILNELKNKGYQDIYYVGSSKNPEFTVISELGVPFLDVPVFGMPRKPDFKLLKWILLLFVSVLKCLGYALKYRPDAVFATGGYVSAPMVIVSNILKIPYVMHDSDAHPGIVTRAFSGGAKAVNLAFHDANRFIKAKKITNFKNPVRDEFFKVSREEARAGLGVLKNEFCILGMGGSQGARTVNEAAIGLIGHFKDDNGVKIIFQTGKKNYDDVKSKLDTLLGGKIPANAIVEPYFDKMYLPILAADVVVSRAGSLSISEILAAKKPSILVPYPYAAANHQRMNAKEIEKLGAAIYIEDADLTADKLIETVEELMKSYEKLDALKNKAAGEITENPTFKILELLLDAAGAENNNACDAENPLNSGV